jgi:Abortive infection alpha
MSDDEPSGDTSAAPAEPTSNPEPPTGFDVSPTGSADGLSELARVTAEAWVRVAAWGFGTTLRLGAEVARAASDPAAAAELYGELADGVRNYAREFLGVNELNREVRLLTPLAGSTLELGDGSTEVAALREQGEALLRAAASVDINEHAHPAYAHILTELAPDEARILRLLAIDGPQPLVDVRAANLIGLGSQLIAPAMNMLGAQAGAQHRDRVPIYLTNLSRLGLIVLSDEELDDPLGYQVLEVQPDVLATIKQTPRARAIRRSIVLTPFGADFCEVCLSPAQTLELPPAVGDGDSDRGDTG